VTIHLKNESTGFTTSTTTNTKGEYIFNQLPLGRPYTLKITHLNYADVVQNGIALNQGVQLRFHFTLKVRSITLDEVQINPQGLSQTIQSLGAATAVTAKDLEKLPVNGRNFTSLIDLSPLSPGGSLSGQIRYIN
jgi:hypothetical protein